MYIYISLRGVLLNGKGKNSMLRFFPREVKITLDDKSPILNKRWGR